MVALENRLCLNSWRCVSALRTTSRNLRAPARSGAFFWCILRTQRLPRSISGTTLTMVRKFDYRERAAHCALWQSQSTSEQAKEIWRQMQEHWQQRAADELRPKNIQAGTAAQELFNNLSRMTRILGGPGMGRASHSAPVRGAHPRSCART
jgi:hypothetical protein